MRNPRAITVAVAVSVTACMSSAGSTALASEKPVREASPAAGRATLPSAARERMMAQRPLRDAAQVVRGAVEQEARSGFAGLAIAGGKVTVWFKGEPSPSVARALRAARQDAPVAVEHAPHSIAELEAASDEMVRWLKAHPDSPLHTVEIANAGRGLVLAADAPLDLTDLPSVDVPVDLANRPRILPTSGRLADVAPFWGGGRINNGDNNAICTSGFAVAAGGVRYMLTAGHCGRPGGSWQTGNDALTIGWATLEHVNHDLLLIPANVGGRIYDGGIGVGEFSKQVVGWGWAAPGEYVCHSGSVSGATCGIRNTTGSFTATTCGNDAYGNYECYGDLVLAEKVDGATAARPGDSGGPVFTLSGANAVIAKGTLTGAGGRWMTYQDFGTAWRDFGIVPV